VSKLSVHISSGKRDGFGDWLKKSNDAGSPIGIIYSVDENISGDIQNFSPTTKWVYRYQTDEFNRTPNGFLEGDPIANATDWMTKTRDSHHRTLMDNWRLNNADWFDPLNEPVPDIQSKAEWFNTWMLTALNIANNNGFKLAYGSFTTGAPEINVLQFMVPSLRRAKELGAILSLHAYWEGNDPSVEVDNALRYRSIYATLPEDARIPIVISEASSGNGYEESTSGIFMGESWVANMARYDVELMKDPYVLGACGFQLGGQESNMRAILPEYATYIAKTPTPANVPVILVTPPNTLPQVDPITPIPAPIIDDRSSHPIDPVTIPNPTETAGNRQPAETNKPLDFDVNVAGCKKDRDRPNGIIVAFQFNVVGGTAPYTYLHEGQTLSGPTFDRLATRSGAIIDNFSVTSADGQTQQKKLFFSPKDMECS
jgi:hypothetical protein